MTMLDDCYDMHGDVIERGAYTVAVYLADRAYGGPEEGGWWFDSGVPAHEFARFCRGFSRYSLARAYADRLERHLLPRVNAGRRDKSSVLSDGVYEIEVVSGVPEAYPADRPVYE